MTFGWILMLPIDQWDDVNGYPIQQSPSSLAALVVLFVLLPSLWLPFLS
jgi:hypothetical protein